MLTVAGVGPGNPKYLTIDVLEKIKSSEYILAFGRISKSLEEIRSDILPVTRVEDVIQYIEEKDKVLLLASGDPCFFGIVEFLKRKGVKIKEVVPGLSSFQYLMARLGKSWDGARFLSLHGREDSLDQVIGNRLTIILTDKTNTPAFISRRLKDLGLKGSMHIGYNLSYEDEIIKTIKIGQELEDESCLAVVVIENEVD